MAAKPRKPGPARARALQSRTDATAVERSKNPAKPTFGKAAPKKVVPGAAKAAANPAKARKHAASNGSKVRTAANIAAGAVVATARGVASLAASVVRRRGSKAKTK